MKLRDLLDELKRFDPGDWNLEYEVWLQRESEEGNHIPHAAITFTQAGGEE